MTGLPYQASKLGTHLERRPSRADIVVNLVDVPPPTEDFCAKANRVSRSFNCSPQRYRAPVGQLQIIREINQKLDVTPGVTLDADGKARFY